MFLYAHYLTFQQMYIFCANIFVFVDFNMPVYAYSRLFCSWGGHHAILIRGWQKRMTNVNIHMDSESALQWRHNGRIGVSNHQPHYCSLNRLFKRRSKETPKLRVTGLCAGTSPVTVEFPAQMASNTEDVSIWWRHLEQHNNLYK